METTFFQAFLESFILLFVIIDPFLGAAIFVEMTRKMKKKEIAAEANTATAVAFGVLLLFLFIGPPTLKILGIDMYSFRIGGGIILFVLGFQAVLGMEFKKASKTRRAAAVLIGTPILCGPGAMTTIIILAEKYGILIPIIASAAVIASAWALLFFSQKVSKFLGERIVQILSRLLGLLLCAIAVQFVVQGITQIFG